MRPTTYVTDRYTITRNLVKGSEYQLFHSAELLEQWCEKTKRPVDLFTLNELDLSWFVKSLELLYAPVSVKKIRGDILCLCNDAADSDFRSVIRQRRVRRPVCPAVEAKAWPREVCERIILACRKLRGKLSNGVPIALYMETIYRCAWRLAIRRGDLFALRMANIQASGAVRLTQRKTRTVTTGRLGTDEIQLLRTIGKDPPLAWPHGLKTFYDWSNKIKAVAGVEEPGYLQRFRRSAATDVAKRDRAAATKLLGHTTSSVDKFYIDNSLLDEEIVEPSRLRLPAMKIGGAR